MLLGLAVLAAVLVWRYRNAQQTPIAQFAKLERGSIEANISATGACNAVVTVQVGSQVSGNIMELLADFNTEVKSGQLIARIDPQVFQARVNHARAGLESAQASVVNARAQVNRARAQIESDMATLDNQNAAAAKARAAVVEAERRLARRLELFERGILSPEDRDTAQANYDQAVAQMRASVAQVDGARHMVQSAEAERRVAETQLSLA
ncbi:MAG TPA: biotin/lipoyl-binding protein, partial [Bryobacteraceae bacterium]|nr:biotin/lipoyl-binding protein [Bryobacteraceae bacterium]